MGPLRVKRSGAPAPAHLVKTERRSRSRSFGENGAALPLPLLQVKWSALPLPLPQKGAALRSALLKERAPGSTGIVHMHNSHDTIVKWVTTANQRSMAVTEVQRLTGTENVEKSAATEVNTNRGKVKDNADWETQEHFIRELQTLFTEKLCHVGVS